ncbi:hypothetical protein PIB30_062306, partial [Stylosanthes scabra]|nr:hypothetical protein [Stylosanthes scabra]
KRMERLLKILVVVTSLVIFVPLCSIAQNTRKDYLEIHNGARASVGCKPLKWNEKLESSAHRFLKKHMEDCLIGTTYLAPSKYAQNTAYDHSRSSTGVDAVAFWVKTKEKYDYKSNSCIDGNPASCAPYLQVVWSATTEVGCARVECNHNKGILVRCHYEPSGNIPGERPYHKRISQNSRKYYLEVHNAARASVGSKPLKWNEKLEESVRRFLKKHIEDCLIGTTYLSPLKHAENTAYHPGSITGAEAVALWVKTKVKYDYKSNSCTDGNPASCAPYLQVVWNATTNVGCARVECNHNKGTLIRCYYEPSGNIPGVRPYILHSIN